MNIIEDFILNDYHLNKFNDNDNYFNELEDSNEINDVWIDICYLVREFTSEIVNSVDKDISGKYYHNYDTDLFNLYLIFLDENKDFEKNLFNFVKKNIDVVLKSEDLNLVLKLFRNEEYIDYCLSQLKSENINFKILNTFIDMDNMLLDYKDYFVKVEKILLEKLNEDNKKIFLDLMLDIFLKYHVVKNDDIKPFLYLYDKYDFLSGDYLEDVIGSINSLEQNFLLSSSAFCFGDDKLEKFNFIKENFNINSLSKLIKDDCTSYYKSYMLSVDDLTIILSSYEKEDINKVIKSFIDSKIFTDKESLKLFLDYYDYDFTNLNNSISIGEALLTKINTEVIDKKIKIDINWDNLNELLDISYKETNFNDFLNHLNKFDFSGKENLLKNYIINNVDRDVISDFLKEKIENNNTHSENFISIIDVFKNEYKSENVEPKRYKRKF